jgi:hypothetical protein
LAAHGAVRMTVDHKPGFPCRIGLADAEPGETVLLLPYEHQSEATPFRAGGPIFVREGAAPARLAPSEIPPYLNRQLSVRAYDKDHMMVEAEVIDVSDLRGIIDRYWSNEVVDYLHVHYAKRGCYLCRIDRT